MSTGAAERVSLAFRWRSGLVLEATRQVTRLQRQLGDEEKSTDAMRYRLAVAAGPAPGQLLIETEVLDKPQVALFSIPLPDLVVDAAGSLVDVRGADRVRAFLLSTVEAGSPEHAALAQLVTPAFVKNAAERDWHPLVSLWAGRTLAAGKSAEVRTRDNSDPGTGPLDLITTLTLASAAPVTVEARSVLDAASSKRMMQAAMQQVAAALPGVNVTVKEQKVETRVRLRTDAGLVPQGLRVTRVSSRAIEVKQGKNVDVVTTFEELTDETSFQLVAPPR